MYEKSAAENRHQTCVDRPDQAMKFCLTTQVDPIEFVETDYCWEVCTDDDGQTPTLRKKKRKEDSKFFYEPFKVIAGNISKDEQVTIHTLNPQIGKDTVLV